MALSRGGKCYLWLGPAKSTKVESEKFDQTELLRVDDDFWPLKKYKRLFGDPNAPANRKRKHVVTKIDGILGTRDTV